MCGIAGLVGGQQSNDDASLLAMIESFRYRGPDDKGTWLSESQNIGLAQARLSIIDTTSAGHQPMLDPDTGNVIVFNGEVYNYIEIRNSLKTQGITFRTETDTEVILKAYAYYGTDCVKYFNGMFAFALWDIKKDELFLVRDRLGIKPLYYYQDDQYGFVFASEIKAIQTYVKIDWKVEATLIDQYMSFGYVPGENTLLKGVTRLLPGHFAILKKGELRIEKYWDLIFDQSEDKGLDYYLNGCRELLEDSINLRLRSDVPLGIFLSGGIDSSAVVGMLASRVQEPLKTFSVAYDFGKNFNESYYANLVSEKFKTDHHTIMVKPEDFKAFIPKYIHLMDEPVTEAAAISLQYVSQLAAEHVTVVLSGEGSDEIFGGYDFYQYMLKIENLRTIVGPGIISSLYNLLKPILNLHPKIAKYAHMATQDLPTRYKGISSYEDSSKQALYNEDFKTHLKECKNSKVSNFLSELFSDNFAKDPLSKMLRFDTKTWLVDDLLIKADRMSMASSLELRVPFLDYRLVEFAAKIPQHYKIRKGNPKYILKKMMANILPDKIINRKKMGFPTPLKIMFQQHLNDYVHNTLLNSTTKLHKIFKRPQIEKIISEHYDGTHDHHRVLWQLIVLEEWLNHNNAEIEIAA